MMYSTDIASFILCWFFNVFLFMHKKGDAHSGVSKYMYTCFFILERLNEARV